MKFFGNQTVGLDGGVAMDLTIPEGERKDLHRLTREHRGLRLRPGSSRSGDFAGFDCYRPRAAVHDQPDADHVFRPTNRQSQQAHRKTAVTTPCELVMSARRA